jgi:UDP-glucuronate 4-epimerase
MRHILITGAAGFIGSHVAEALLGAGAAVTGIDNFDLFYPRPLKEENLAGCRTHPSFRFLDVDIRDPAALRGAAGPYQAIVHLAAKAGVRPSILDPLAYQQTNVAGTQNLLEFAREYGVGQFVFASSSSVYGINPNSPWREDDHVLLPISPYASTKVSGELLGHVYSHLYGLRFLALRFFTVYGPRQRPDLAIRKFAEQILAGRPVVLFGDGSTSRDYTYIDDIVAGVLAAITYTASRYEVINLGNHRTVGLLEMVKTLERVLGRRAVLEFRPEQPGDVPITYADIGKAERLLGYCPRTSFADGVAVFADWLRRSGTNR